MLAVGISADVFLADMQPGTEAKTGDPYGGARLSKPPPSATRPPLQRRRKLVGARTGINRALAPRSPTETIEGVGSATRLVLRVAFRRRNPRPRSPAAQCAAAA